MDINMPHVDGLQATNYHVQQSTAYFDCEFGIA